MSNFNNARNFRIDNFVNNFNNSKSALEVLQSCITPGAIHNSDERSDAPSCMPETRVAVQNDIISWVEADVEDQNMMWLSGPAGSGKTAIAGTVAETCNERGTLAASFFFSSFSPSVDRSSKKGFVATLAYQLRQHPSMASVGEGTLAAIDKDPMILRKRLKDQMEELILRPMRQFGVDGADLPPCQGARPRLIVVDGLDECLSDRSLPEDPEKRAKIQLASQHDQLEVLNALLAASKDPSFPFKILIVSRPERVITEFFATSAQSNTVPLFLDNKYDPDSDIRLFLTSSFADIRRRYHIPASWPLDEQVEGLVERASGQFIYVATIIRFIQGRSGSPQSQLDSVLSLDSSKRHNSQAFADLDALYSHILMSSPNPYLASSWISIVTSFCVDCTSPTNRKPHSALFCRQFLESSPGEAERLLGDLGSLILTPPHEDQDSPYSLFHASLREFVGDDKRCLSRLQWSPGCDAYEVFGKAFRKVLIHQGPTTHLTPIQLVTFQQKFLTMEPLHWSLSINCDVSWWTNQILCHSENRAIVVSYLTFARRHYSTRSRDGARQLPRKVYRLWTKSKFKECRKRGWETPSKTEMFMRDVNALLGRRREPQWDIEPKFVPPTATKHESTDVGDSAKRC